jgi:hypothetical protein
VRTSVGPYQVVRELGRGGMGVVFEVQRPGDPRRLALKLMLGEQDPDAVARFRREAEVMARVNHAHVVRVHAFDVEPEGPYLVTDFVEGKGLDGVLEDRFLPCEQAATLVRDLADALEALHRAGILHRDLKPANVIIRPDGSPVLLDFGIARDLDSKERLTVTGALIGTPSYMAPEQANGVSPSRMGPPVDVYGLGTILYEALTCRPPHVAGSQMAILKKVMTEDPVWPSALRRDVPEALDAIVRLAMAKESLLRYRTAAAMRDDLSMFLKGEEPAALKQAPKPRRSRGALLAAATAVGLVGIGIGALAVRPPEEAPVTTTATDDRQRRPPPRPTHEPTSRMREMRDPMLFLPHPGHRCRGRFLDDQRIVTWNAMGQVRVWRFDRTSHELLHERALDISPEQNEEGSETAVVLPDVAIIDSVLYLRGEDRIVRAKLPDLTPIEPARSERLETPGTLGVLPDGSLVAPVGVPAGGSPDDPAADVRIIDRTTLAVTRRLKYAAPPFGRSAATAVSPDGVIAVSGGDIWSEARKNDPAGDVHLLTLDGPATMHRQPPSTYVLSLAWRPKGEPLLAIGTYSEFVLLRGADGRLETLHSAVAVEGGPSLGMANAKTLAFSPDGRWLAVAFAAHSWDEIPSQDPGKERVTVAEAAERRGLRTLRIWKAEASAWRLAHQYSLPACPGSIAWSPDGRLLLIALEYAGDYVMSESGAQVWMFDESALQPPRGR